MIDLKKAQAADIMSRAVVTLDPGTRLRQAIETLSEEGISGAPVVDDGHPVGVLSMSDVLRRTAGKKPARRMTYYSLAESDEPAPFEQDEEVGDLLDTCTGSETMTPTVIAVPADATIVEVAQVMSRRRIHRVLVTDDGKLVGMLSALDIVRALGRPAYRLARG